MRSAASLTRASYGTFDWRVQTPGGQVLDSGFTSEQDLGSGDLVARGVVSGNVVLEMEALRVTSTSSTTWAHRFCPWHLASDGAVVTVRHNSEQERMISAALRAAPIAAQLPSRYTDL